MENYFWNQQIRGTMKKSDLKRLIKPIVRECITEALVEQGLLSNIISEVVKGLRPIHTQVPSQVPSQQASFQQKQLEEQRAELEYEQQRQLKEQKRKLLDAAGFGTDIFAGTQPIHEAADPSNGQAGALAGTDPSDAGVDIGGLLAVSGKNWNKLI
jgi:hypothetical protein